MTRARLVRKRDEHSARSLARWSSALHANEENGCAGRTDRRTGEIQKCRGGNRGRAWKGSSSLDDGGAHRQRVKSSQGNGTEGRLHLLNQTQTCTLPVPLSVPLRLSISRLPAAPFHFADTTDVRLLRSTSLILAIFRSLLLCVFIISDTRYHHPPFPVARIRSMCVK